jgi:hypothetical protein
VKEMPVAERIRLDASLFPLHLVNLVDSLLQMSFRRETVRVLIETTEVL